MQSTAMRITVGLAAAALIAGSAAAAPASQGVQAAAPMADATNGCHVPDAGEIDVFAQRAEQLARYEQLPPECLKTIVLACNKAAGQTLLDLGSAAVCSIGYEALLRRGFGGNFQAMVAWWRSQREPAAMQ